MTDEQFKKLIEHLQAMFRTLFATMVMIGSFIQVTIWWRTDVEKTNYLLQSLLHVAQPTNCTL